MQKLLTNSTSTFMGLWFVSVKLRFVQYNEIPMEPVNKVPTIPIVIQDLKCPSDEILHCVQERGGGNESLVREMRGTG